MVGIVPFWEGARLAHMGGWVCTRGAPLFGTQWPRRHGGGPGGPTFGPEIFRKGPGSFRNATGSAEVAFQALWLGILGSHKLHMVTYGVFGELAVRLT